MATLQLARRVRTRAAVTGRGTDLKEKLNSLAKAEASLLAAKATYDKLQEELLHAMQAAGQKEVKSGVYTATIVTPQGRSTRTIDVKKFQKKVTPADFYACISVSVTEAKKVLAEKDLNAISTTVEGKQGEETLKITKTKV